MSGMCTEKVRPLSLLEAGNIVFPPKRIGKMDFCNNSVAMLLKN